MTNIVRNIKLPNRTFFLFGPRSTGKTTWLNEVLSDSYKINLLHTDVLLKFTRDPSLLRKIVEALSIDQWVVVDEVQKLPELLDEVHDLLQSSQNKRKFALTGSSARKLKAKSANMLAGRALRKEFFPLTLLELNDFDIEDILQFGLLPMVRTAQSKEEKVDILESYAMTYLKEEIQQEALVKNLDAFFRFLQICGIMNGQILNISNIGRDVGVSRTAVNGHFEILIDTLLGFKLPVWEKKIKVKEISHPKFYLFDVGVSRCLANSLRLPLEGVDRGFLFETIILNELRAFNAYENLGGVFSFWSAPPQFEIDIIWTLGKINIGIEVKTSRTWKRDFSKTLNELIEKKKITRGYGIYLGEDEMRDGNVLVLPLKIFLKKLEGREILF
jgi:predicted AAA+ superfamily ATPase